MITPGQDQRLNEPDKTTAGLSAEHQAFSEAYEDCFQRVYRYIAIRVGDPFEAEDLASETFLRAWEHLSSFQRRDGVPFAAWLFRIAHNLVVDHLRRTSRRSAVPLTDGLASEMNTEEAVEIHLTFNELKQAMQELTEAQRQVIGLRFAAGLSLAEVARVVNRSEGAVKALQHAAVASLRRNMGRSKR